MTTVKVQKLTPDAITPRYAHGASADAGMDLHSTQEVTIEPMGRALVDTGLALELPDGIEGQIRPRSGLALKHGITVLNAPGTVDPSYRGPIMVILANLSQTQYTVRPGDRIAQIVFSRYEPVEAVEVEQVNLASTRGANGFGSTGR